MKKLIKTLVPLSLVAVAAAYAGGPEVAPPPPAPCVTPYIDLMGGGSWRDIEQPYTDGTDLFSVISNSDDNWGARAAVGLMFPYNPVVSLTTEVGWGYYGRTRQTRFADFAFAPVGGLVNDSATFNSYGFDVLIGAMYNVYPGINLFLKLGALMQNFRTSINSFGVLGAGGLLANGNTVTDHTTAEPEVMVGGQYMFNEWFGVEVAYAHMFGEASNPLGTFVPSAATPFGVALNRNFGAPTIDVVFGGVTIRFPAV